MTNKEYSEEIISELTDHINRIKELAADKKNTTKENLRYKHLIDGIVSATTDVKIIATRNGINLDRILTC